MENINRQGEEEVRSVLENLQLSDAVHLCSATQEQVSLNQTQLVVATLSELVSIRAAYLQAFSSQQKRAIHSRYFQSKDVYIYLHKTNRQLALKCE